MSRDFDNIMKEIMKQHKELHSVDAHISKDITELKRSLKNIENKTNSIDQKLTEIIMIINNLTLFISDAEDADYDADDMENESWSPYGENDYEEPSYEDEDESEDL